ncbi:MAG: hypothetical protein PHH16_05240 [Candidatus Gracilibacteria bacterium]|nr:hypothetical protein [Candidatus Gracilibacteria bacterium]
MCEKSKTAIQLSRMVSLSDVRGAEQVLMELANQPDGDSQIMAVIEKLPSADLLAIVREFDLGSPSLLHSFITPKQFGAMIQMEGQYGSEKSAATSHAHSMISAIVFGEHVDPDNTPADFLREMWASEEGTRMFMKFILPSGGLIDDEDRRHEQIRHFAEFGTFDLESEIPDPTAMNHDMDWRQAVQIIMTEPYEGELFLQELESYKNKREEEERKKMEEALQKFHPNYTKTAPTASANPPVASGESAL